jgi:exosortase
MDFSRHLARLLASAPIFAAILAVGLLYFPSLATLWRKWVLWDQDLAHAIPTIGVMLVLLWRNNYVTKETHPANFLYWLLLIATATCSLGWYFFESLSISLPAYFLLIATLCFFIAASFSAQVMWAILPILGLLVFTIPIWSELTSLLVNLSSLVVGKAVKLSNITVLIDGSSLFLPSGTIYIADGCSGIRYLIISILMGYILILINQYKLRTAVATLVMAVILGLVANWLRIYLLVLIGYHTEMQSSLISDHETFGWVLFACLLVPAIYFSPIGRPPVKVIALPKWPRLLPVAALSLGPLLLNINSTIPSPHSPLQLNHLDQFKISTREYIGTQLSPSISGSDKRLVELEQVKIRVDLFTNVPTSPREEIVPHLSGLLDRSDWMLEQTLPESHGRFTLAIYKKVGGNRRIIIATQYIVGKMQTDKYIAAKFMQIIANAAGDKYFGLLTAQTNCARDCSDELGKLIKALPAISLPQD